MTGWQNSDRRQHLPSNWTTLRKQRFRMDGFRCTHRNDAGQRCPSPAEECDHIGDRTDHRIEMLRSLCRYHHGKKTGAQGAWATHAVRRKNAQKFKRVEAHPGLL